MAILVTGQPNNFRVKEKRGVIIGPPRRAEVEYRERLIDLNRGLKARTDLISARVRDGADVAEAARLIELELAAANREYDAAAAEIAGDWTATSDNQNKERITRMLRNSLGVDTVALLDDEEIRPELDLARADSVRLIKSISEEHFGRVTQAVIANYRGERFEEGGLAARLKKIGTITDRRAKFIARDQTAKLVSSLNEVRNQAAGIEGYLWRNAGDIRVTGAPGGPNEPSRIHGNHFTREGKFVRYDKPPADGHAGHAIGCRCRQQPVIDVEKVLGNALRV